MHSVPMNCTAGFRRGPILPLRCTSLSRCPPCWMPYQPALPETPLNGPARSAVTQPP